MALPSTCFHEPWALVRRNGDTPGKRVSTRMAYLTGTVAIDGLAVGVKGYIMNGDMEAWTRAPRRIEWGEILKQWRRQPSKSDVKRAKAKLPVASATP